MRILDADLLVGAIVQKLKQVERSQKIQKGQGGNSFGIGFLLGEERILRDMLTSIDGIVVEIPNDWRYDDECEF